MARGSIPFNFGTSTMVLEQIVRIRVYGRGRGGGRTAAENDNPTYEPYNLVDSKSPVMCILVGGCLPLSRSVGPGVIHFGRG